MKKLSLSKQLLLAGSIMIAASACQCQKSPEPQGPSESEMEQNEGSCEEEEEEEDTCRNSRSVREQKSADYAPVQTKTSSQESGGALTEKKSPAPASGVSEVRAEKSASAETPKLEAVKAVSESTSPQISPSKD